MLGLDDTFINFQIEKSAFYSSFNSKFKDSNDYDKKKDEDLSLWIDMFIKLHEIENDKIVQSREQQLEKLTETEKNYDYAFEYPLAEGVFKNQLLKIHKETISFLSDKDSESAMNIFMFKHNIMKNINPKFVIRRHVLQKSIKKAEQDDFSLLNEQFGLFIDPFKENNDLDVNFSEYEPDIKSCDGIKLSCSS